jgi:hypothetical protein
MTSSRFFRGFLFGLGILLYARAGAAQIDHPNSHVDYSAELEPHLVVQWEDEPVWGGDGIGVGLRGSFPVIKNGPVTTINNSLALGIGLDWAHFGDRCWGPNGVRLVSDCSANDFWIPLVVQWNFFFSDFISAFPELGIGIQHTRWDGAWCVNNGNRFICDNGGGSGSRTDVDLVFWLGVRFHLAPRFALTLRLGTPSLLLGASFLL